MGKFIVRGGAPLYGKVKVSGSKNASLAVLFASLAAKGVSEIENLPDIGDVRAALEILRRYGALISREDSTTRIDTTCLSYISPPRELTSQIRASTYLLGASLVRFHKVGDISLGGCSFSSRPIDIHIAAMLSHGARLTADGICADRLVPSDITLRLPSVGATVNSLIIAAAIKGKSIIRGVALEPHIFTLIDYLRSMGAEISREGATLTVVGGELHGGRIRIGGDMIEAGSYIVMGALCGGELTVEGAEPGELDALLAVLDKSGVKISRADGITVRSRPQSRISVVAEPYPGFPTDLQPIIAPLLSIRGGEVRDEVWRERFGYLEELRRFGLRYRMLDGCAEIFPSELHSASASTPDLRGGAALLSAALASDGESVIEGAEIVMRGYEGIEEKLGRVGAEIEYLP